MQQVTGASGGIGIVTAEEFLRTHERGRPGRERRTAEPSKTPGGGTGDGGNGGGTGQGAKVTLHYNGNAGPAVALAAQHPGQAFAVQAALEDEASVHRAVAAAVEHLGPVNVLVVNHGIWPPEDVLVKDMSLAQWNNTIGVNLTASFLISREFLRQIEAHRVTENVAIVLIGSTAGKFGEAYHADYACTKSALMGGLLLSLKNEIVKIAPRGRVNCVAPGWVRTPMADKAMGDMGLLFQALATSPLRKVSEPVEVARAILFLSSEVASGNITGHVIDINAGMEGRLLNKREDFGA